MAHPSRTTVRGGERSPLRCTLLLAHLVFATGVICAQERSLALLVNDADGSDLLAGKAETSDASPLGNDALDTSFGSEELLLFEPIPVVVSASRKEQRRAESSLAIGIVDASTIRESGLSTVPEILQFTPGVDVLATDRNNVALGVRGLHHQFSDRTLVLIDGRNATSATYGGVDFFRLPIFPDDIAQIEIVRGPGGAAWGPNALNGVINIITKAPRETTGLSTLTRVTEFGDILTNSRWAGVNGRWAWSVSAGYESRESSDEAISHDDFSSRDFSEDWRLSSKLLYEVNDRDTLDFGAAFAHVERGDFEIAGFPMLGDPRDDERIDVARLHARMTREADDWTGYVQWFGNFADVSRPSIWGFEEYENDLEAQVDLELSPHHLTVGGNARWVHIEHGLEQPQDFLDRGTENEFWAGIFGIHRWQLTDDDDLALETQLRADWYSGTKVDWSGRVSVLYAVDDEQNHRLRIGAAKAFRAPLFGVREARIQRLPLPSPPLPPGSFGVQLFESDDLDHEEVYSLETGYSGALTPDLTARVNLYYQRYEDLIGFADLPDPLGLGRVLAVFDNINGGDAFGGEVELEYRLRDLFISAWYAHNNFSPDATDQSVRGFRPAKNKVGLGVQWALPHGFSASAHYKYTSRTNRDSGSSGASVSDFHRVDLAVTKRLADDRLDLTVGVHDLFDETALSVQQIGAFSSHETPGRTVFVQFRLRL